MKDFFEKHCIAILVSVGSYFMPVAHLIFAVGFLSVCDMVLGIWAAKKRQEKIISWKAGKTISKLILYSLAIVLSHIIEKEFLTWFHVAQICASTIALVEFKSCIEKITEITGIDLVKSILNKIDSLRTSKNISDEQKEK